MRVDQTERSERPPDVTRWTRMLGPFEVLVGEFVSMRRVGGRAAVRHRRTQADWQEHGPLHALPARFALPIIGFPTASR
jgi:hypothetical protein